MYTHFTTSPMIEYPSIYPTQWNNLYKELATSIRTFTKHHHQNVSAVNVDHPLVKLITLMNVPLYLSPERYYLLVLEKYRSIAENLGFGTDQISARAIPNVKNKLYKQSGFEVGIAHSTPLVAEDAYRKWRTLEPLKIITHHCSDVNPKALQLADYNDALPYVVYTLDVPMLMLQFKAWFDLETLNYKKTGSRKNLQNFVKMFPLTNAVKSHVDIALIELLYRVALNEDIKKSNDNTDKNDLGVFVNNTNSTLGQFVKLAVTALHKTPMSFNAIIQNCPTLSGNGFTAMRMPPIAPLGQSAWPLSLAALRFWRILFALSKENSRSINRPIIDKIKREFRIFNTERYWKNHLPTSTFEYAMKEQETLLKQLG